MTSTNTHSPGTEKPLSATTKPRIGLLVPSSNTIMEADLQQAFHDNASVHSARMRLVETTADAEGAMLDTHFEPALADVATANPHVIIFGCTSAGGLRGPEYDSALCARIEEVSGATAISTVAAAARSLAEAKESSIAVLTPYVEALNSGIRRTFEASGVNVVGIRGLGITDNFRLSEPKPSEIEEHAVRLLEETEADMLFISCTNFRSLEAVPQIEARTNRRVLTSNLAVINAVNAALQRPGA